MKAIICGGRDFSNYDYLCISMDQCRKWWNLTTIITGGARGADTLGHRWAVSRKLDTEVYPADWDRFGKGAGFIRNELMLSMGPSVVIAYKGGNGTEHMINISRQANVPVFIL